MTRLPFIPLIGIWAAAAGLSACVWTVDTPPSATTVVAAGHAALPEDLPDFAATGGRDACVSGETWGFATHRFTRALKVRRHTTENGVRVMTCSPP